MIVLKLKIESVVRSARTRSNHRSHRATKAKVQLCHDVATARRDLLHGSVVGIRTLPALCIGRAARRIQSKYAALSHNTASWWWHSGRGA